ncbi:hypothetical protein [Flavihumibacter fluvii]|uniref:hypothetical protein n=1 Tax=Flavihumibacter fluvii TaxID=2838157 RepID=UPI001BDED8F5|nr:hypothetical protein [Flavihumibacter fluvii]ULQ54620.1 hypothetical protein KJS93_09845 [Flavihumibacter fluvii]
MTLKFTAVLCLLSILMVFGNSCQKPIEVEPKPIPVPAEIMVKKLQASENDFLSFTYNDNNHVTRYVSQWKSSVEGASPGRKATMPMKIAG